VKLVSEVFTDGSFAEGAVAITPFAEVEGCLDFTLPGGLPEDFFEFGEPGFERRIVEGEVGQEVGLGMGFEEFAMTEGEFFVALVLFELFGSRNGVEEVEEAGF